MSNITKYTGLDLALLDEADQKVQEIAGGDFETLEVGENVFRFLPAASGPPIRVTAMHYIDAVPGLDKMVVFACPRVELKQPCVACAKADELGKTGNPLDRERAYRISAQLRVYANVVNRKRPGAPKVLAFGKQIWEQLKSVRRNPRVGGDFMDPGPGGFDVVILREGTGKNDTRYTVAPDRANSPLAATDEEIGFLIDATKDLDSLIKAEPTDELLAAWGRSMAMPVRSASHGALPPRAAPTLQHGGVGVGLADKMRASAAARAPAASAVIDAEAVSNDDFD